MDTEQLLAAASEHFNAAKPFIPMYIHLLLSALFPIYTGAHASLSRPSSAAKPEKQKRNIDSEDGEDEDEEVQKMEGLSAKDAVVFPVMAGMVLAGLYFLIKRYGADLINLVLGWYFAFVGVYSVAKLVNDAAMVGVSFLLPTYFARSGKLFKVDGTKQKAVAQGSAGEVVQSRDSPIPYLPAVSKSFYDGIWTLRSAVKQRYATRAYLHDFLDFKANLTVINFASALVGVATVAYANLVAKPWYLTNLQGFAVCYSALQLMSPTSFPTGSLILGGLFFYDIWAVFFTPLMVTVAKNLDQPIKLVFPRPDGPAAAPGEPAPPRSYSMLGLGDIVLPGIMIGLALRFDLYMYYVRKQRKATRTTSSSDGETKDEQVTEKAPYVQMTGLFGDRFWTAWLPACARPEKLSASFPKPYFIASMVGYVVGMLTTLAVMSVFQHAQPALLYLVPGVLISLWGTALVRGEFGHMWSFTEAVNAEQVEDDGKGKKTEGKEEQNRSDGRSMWQKVWDEVFGRAEEKPNTEGEKTNDGKQTGKQSVARGNAVLFSLSVARYIPEASKAPVSTLEEDDDTSAPSTPQASSQDRSQASSESDLVLIDGGDA